MDPNDGIGVPHMSRFSNAPMTTSTPAKAEREHIRFMPHNLSMNMDSRPPDSEDEDDGPEEAKEKKALMPKRKPPVQEQWCLVPSLLFLGYLTSAFFYFRTRVEGVIAAGWPPYQVYFIVLEWIGVSAFLPYAILLTRGVFPTGSPGLPPAGSEDDDHLSCLTGLVDGYRMHVRVLVPCYKEPLEVIMATIKAAYEAPLPAHVKRTIYLCDDGKSDDKRAFIESLPPEDVQYVTGRPRKPNEINGKSANLNNCLRKIYGDLPKDEKGDIDWSEISNKELLVVFDADMCAKQDFFLKLLEIMADDNIALCLTPQSFYNIDPGIDLFNAINVQFWEYWLPGAFAWGYIACTGTNFCLRVRPLAHCGWFPEYTITEDYALGMELKTRGYKATYLMDYIAAGEAPEEIRNVLRQRSRWTKGHYQVFFSRRNSLINWDLPFFQRLWYAYAAWSPFCTTLTVPGFMVAPLISVIWGIHPLVITYDFVFYSTIYFFIQLTIQFYCRKVSHLKLMWYVNMSNVVLWFTFTKAFWNSVLGALGLKAVMFKVTDKVVKAVTGDSSEPSVPAPHESSGPGPDVPPPDENMLQRVARMASRTVSQVSYKVKNAFTPAKKKRDEDMFERFENVRSSRSRYAAPGGQRTASSLMLPNQPDGQSPITQKYGVQMRNIAAEQASAGDTELMPTSGDASGNAGVGAGVTPTKHARPDAEPASLDVKYMHHPRLPSDPQVEFHMPPTGELPVTPQRSGYDAPFEFDSPGPSASMIFTRNQATVPVNRPATTVRPALPVSTTAAPRHDTELRSPMDDNAGIPPSQGNSGKVMFADADMYPGSPLSRVTSMMSSPASTVQYSSAQKRGQPETSSFMRDIKSMFEKDMLRGSSGGGAKSKASGSSMLDKNAKGSRGVSGAGSGGLKAPLHDIGEEEEAHPSFSSPRDRNNAYKAPPPVATGVQGGHPQQQGIPQMMPVVSAPGVVQMVPVMHYPVMSGNGLIPAVMPYGDGLISNPLYANLAGIGKFQLNEDKKHIEDDSGKNKKKEESESKENFVKNGKERFLAVLESFKPQNVSDFGKMFDPLALFCMWAFNIVCFALAIWQLVLVFDSPTVAAFSLNSPLSGNPYLLIACFWSLYNSVAPYLFIHYCFSSGASFRWMTKYLPTFSTAVMIAGVVMLWLMIPSDVKLDDALDLAIKHFLPNSIASDTNTNFVFVTGLAATPVVLPALLSRGIADLVPLNSSFSGNASRKLLQSNTSATPNLLGGLFAGHDHVKSVAPTSHTLTWMAWSMTSFPAGYTTEQIAALNDFFRKSSDYLMRSNLNPEDPNNPVFVAQLGDSSDYIVVNDTGYDPRAAGKIWTAPSQDPQLSGKAPRKAWLLTRETPGADLLADAAAALAAASVVLKTSDPGFAANALKHAKYLYHWANTNRTKPQSYCRYLPCVSNVTVTRQARLKPVPKPSAKPKCWLADWDSKICKVGWTDIECNNIRRKNNDLFLQKSACCAAMKAAEAWVGLYTAAQGLCALPDDQWTCYTPDMNQRTCYAQAINKTDGSGCSGQSLEVFSSALSCCNFLQAKGIIDINNGRAPTGLCARTGVDSNFTKCYIPNVINSTCDIGTGRMCETFGIVTSYDTALACCSNLAVQMKGTQMIKVDSASQVTYVTLQGICEPYTGPTPSPFPTLTPADLGTFETDAGVIDTSGSTPIPSPAPAPITVETTIDPTAILGNDVIDLNDVINTNTNSRRMLLGDMMLEDGTNEVPIGRAEAAAESVLASQGGLPETGMVTKDDMALIRQAIAAAMSADRAMHASKSRVLLEGDDVIAETTEIQASDPEPRQLVEVKTVLGGGIEYDFDEDDLDDRIGRRLTQSIDAKALTALIEALAKNTKEPTALSSKPDYSDNTTYWPLPIGAAFLEDPCAKPGSCELMEIQQEVNVTFYNSTSVMDNMAWAAVWLHMATGDSQYLGDAQYYLDRHYAEELPANIMAASREVYRTDWDNQAWAVNLMLANITKGPKYEDRVKQVLTVWLFGDAVKSEPPQGLDEETVLNGRTYPNVTLIRQPTSPGGNATNITYSVIPECIPTNTFEQFCFDGKDDDCNGLIDREDIACGLFPITYTPKEVAWAAQPSLPLAANNAYMAMVYANMVSGKAQTRLRCWALSQMGHMLGSGALERSYVVGVGKQPPEYIQHRASSCLPASSDGATTSHTCDWSSGFYPYSPNPQLDLVKGALVAGPDNQDNMLELRSADDMRVAVHWNAGFLGTLAALTATDTRVRSCESFHGVFQRYIVGGENRL